MKTSILTVFVLISSLVMGQDKKQCPATTKAGTQCTRKTEGQFCKQHDPSTPKCIETAKSTGKRCTRSVKKEGEKCVQHSKATSYLYNAYDKEQDENYVVKSYIVLPKDTIVYVDNKAVVTNRITKDKAIIISLYSK